MCKNVRKTRSQIAAVGPLVAWSEPSFANGYGGQWTWEKGEWEEGKAERDKEQSVVQPSAMATPAPLTGLQGEWDTLWLDVAVESGVGCR